LNSSLYRPRFAFVIFLSLSPLEQLAKGYVLQGQGQLSVPVPSEVVVEVVLELLA
jgi:hypothetical protein